MIHSRSLQTMALAFCALVALICTGSVVPLVEAEGANKSIDRKKSHSPNNGRNRSRHNFSPKHERKDGHSTHRPNKAGADEFKRTSVFGAYGAKDGFLEGSPITPRALSGKGKGGSKKNKNKNRNSDGFSTVENAAAVSNTSATLAVYDNKCDAAEAGAEFKTSSFVKLYYQYEIVTSSSRNILEIADIVDKAIQHFLAVWMVDCDTTAASNVADASSTTNAAGTTSATTTNAASATSATTTNVAASTATTNAASSTPTKNFADDVDDTTLSGFGTRRHLNAQKEQRQLQMSLVPIAGTGVGDYDTVLLGGTDAEQCSSLVASSLLGQVCYKVVGSVLVYIDETMQVTPQDVLTLALETLTVGMNYAATDFSALDPDIYGLMLVQGYDEPPEDLLRANWEANRRPWDTTSTNTNPYKGVGSRSGGAKFGIAFVTLLCIVVFLFVCVYVFKNRERLFQNFDWEEFFCCCCTCQVGNNSGDRRRNQNKHYSMDDSITLPSTVKSFDPRSDGNDNATATRRNMPAPTIGTFSSSPDSTGTKPLSPDPETPHYPPSVRERIIRVVQQQPKEEKEQLPKELDEDPTFLEQKSNIVSPRSDWSVARSNVAGLRDSDDLDDEESCMREPETPDDRIRIKLSKEAIRGSYKKETPKSLSSPRNYECEDTVDL